VAFYENPQLTAVKSFIVQTPGVSDKLKKFYNFGTWPFLKNRKTFLSRSMLSITGKGSEIMSYNDLGQKKET
jgi:hypothetical protein